MILFSITIWRNNKRQKHHYHVLQITCKESLGLFLQHLCWYFVLNADSYTCWFSEYWLCGGAALRRGWSLICLTRVLMFRGNSMHECSVSQLCGFWSFISHCGEESNANTVWALPLWEYFLVCPALTQEQGSKTQQWLMHCFKSFHLPWSTWLNPNFQDFKWCILIIFVTPICTKKILRGSSYLFAFIQEHSASIRLCQVMKLSIACIK